jgi:O-antigen/teichoic acid export membrane protein
MVGFYMVNTRADAIMVGAIRGTSAAGIYTVAARLARLLTWGVLTVNAIGGPLISDLYARGEHRELQRMVSLAAGGIAAFTVPAAAFMVLAGPWMLGIFGPEFTAGYGVLVLLAAAYSIRALSGTVGMLLAMTGHQREAAWGVGSGAAVNILLNALLIPRFGMLGGAIATATSSAFYNCILYLLVRSRLNLEPTVLGLFRSETETTEPETPVTLAGEDS